VFLFFSNFCMGGILGFCGRRFGGDEHMGGGGGGGGLCCFFLVFG
jgi:hypothetical protein